MSQKIYKLCLVRGYTEAYHQLSEEEKQQFFEEQREVFEGTGAKPITPLMNCRWATDKYRTFFVLEYPNLDAAIADTKGVEKIGMFRYLVSETILGIEESMEETIS
ncbi:MAG: hypothetical protein R2867_30740 [Caldilineaceae bacterium]